MVAAAVLVIDNSRFFAGMIASAVEQQLGLPTLIADSLDSARRVIAGNEVLVAISGLELPDGRDQAVVDFFLRRKIPLVVATAVFDEPTRSRIISHPVVDYVLKDAPTTVETLVCLVRRIERNRRISVLVVDDSPSFRAPLVHQLRLYRFTVHEAGNGLEGLAALQADPAVRLVITDYLMPLMDGVEMTRRMRATHPRDKLAIIGLSGSAAGGEPLSARFIKNGANDFLTKPFQREELFCRVTQNIEALENMAALRELATRDALTGLFNRRHFFESGRRLHAEALAGRRKLSAAMLDIDFFKRINDTHGHEAGDKVLQHVARTLEGAVRRGDVLARLGGEEFCVLTVDLPDGAEQAFFEELRQSVAAAAVEVGGRAIPVTSSIGVCAGHRPSLEGMLGSADEALYRAKEMGRNRVELVS